MTTGQTEVLEGSAVGPQFVGHDQPGHKALFSEELAHQPQRGAIAPSLHRHIQDLALVIDGAPEVPTRDPHNRLIKMPPITRARTPFPQPLSHRRSELQHSAADRFIGNIVPMLRKQILHVAVARGEAEIEPVACWIIGGGKRWRR
jgi:hypothetical protein